MKTPLFGVFTSKKNALSQKTTTVNSIYPKGSTTSDFLLDDTTLLTVEERQETPRRSLASLAFVSQATTAAASVGDNAAAIAAPQGAAVDHPPPRPFHLQVLLILMLILEQGQLFPPSIQDRIIFYSTVFL